MAGWIKRGPNGFIGTSKSCAQETVKTLVDDYNRGWLRDPVAGPSALDRLVLRRQHDLVDYRRWRAIERVEIQRGEAAGRPRDKLSAVARGVTDAGARTTRSLLHTLLHAARM